MTVKISPSTLAGRVTPPPSKSLMHRFLFCDALSCLQEGTNCTFFNPDRYVDGECTGKDVLATIDCLNKLIKFTENNCSYSSVLKLKPEESGTTLRFMLPLTSFYSMHTEFHCRGRLTERPLLPLSKVLPVRIEYHDNIIKVLRTEGAAFDKDFLLDARTSSQFVSAILFLLPLLGGGSISLSSPAVSVPYIDLTVDVMRHFGIEVKTDGSSYQVCADNKYRRPDSPLLIERDWSAAAYWLTANSLGGKIDVSGLNSRSMQGDKRIIDIIQQKPENGKLNINLQNSPDIIPILCIWGCFQKFKLEIKGISHLRFKESNRIEACLSLVSNIGGNIRLSEDENAFIIEPNTPVGGEVYDFEDHRIAMAAIIAGNFCKNGVILHTNDSISKSYPNFIAEFRRLGGCITDDAGHI